MLGLWWVPVDERKGRQVIEISARTVNTILVHAQKEKLQTMLKPMMRNNTISVWDDRKI
jgi:imidazoleglycerol phosphate dehydratase HisB